MKVILVMVSSINGKITKGTKPNVSAWTSSEDKKLFSSMKEKAKLIVMGSSTYEQARDQMKHVPGRLRIVLTRTPEKYTHQVIPGQLEFSNEPPNILVSRIAKGGYKELLLTGGSEINALFFEQNLVDEIHVTLEPWIFGSGINLTGEGDYNIKLALETVQKLNKQGTLHLIYRRNASL